MSLGIFIRITIIITPQFAFSVPLAGGFHVPMLSRSWLSRERESGEPESSGFLVLQEFNRCRQTRIRFSKESNIFLLILELEHLLVIAITMNIWQSSEAELMQYLWLGCEPLSSTKAALENDSRCIQSISFHYFLNRLGSIGSWENFNKVMHSTLKILLPKFAPSPGWALRCKA